MDRCSDFLNDFKSSIASEVHSISNIRSYNRRCRKSRAGPNMLDSSRYRLVDSIYFISFTKLQSTSWLNGISFVSLSLSLVSCTSSCTPLSEMMPSSVKELIDAS
jgi:hypothetical protein